MIEDSGCLIKVKVKVERYEIYFFDYYVLGSSHSYNEKNFSVIFLKVSTFCSASITTLLYSYLTLNDFSTVRNKLDFLPSSVISILSTISNFSSTSHLIFL